MPRPPTGQVLELRRKRGKVYALRFRAYGQRQYVTLGSPEEGWTTAKAEVELANVLADVRRGIWQPPEPAPVAKETMVEPDFHTFASEWIAMREQERLAPRTIEDYRWCLSSHLLPYFARHKLSEITIREVDQYKTKKAAEGNLSPNSINKTLSLLSTVLGVAVEYELIAANPATGRRRRLKGTRPHRPWVEPEQLLTLLEAAERYLISRGSNAVGRGRPLMAVLAGAGLRVSEALALERREVNLAKGTLTIRRSKTHAGSRVVDLTPALRDELAVYLDRSRWKRPADLVFPTSKGKQDNRSNVRNRLFRPAIRDANDRLVELGIEPIGKVGPHGLRRTYASLRAAAGDDVAYITEQIGHIDSRFTLRVYAAAVKRRQRLTDPELKQFNLALEWAQWAATGTNSDLADPAVAAKENEEARKPSIHTASSEWS
jgi:integrase